MNPSRYRAALVAQLPAFLRAYPGLSVAGFWALRDDEYRVLFAGLRGT